MSNDHPPVYHGNRFHGEAACEHCHGIIRHEPWCITVDPAVYYAYQIVADPTKISPADAMTLHSLGVSWTGACDCGKQDS